MYAGTAIPAPESISSEIAGIDWYHTMRLPGERVTAGFYDTLTAIERIPFPRSLDGLRCLDVGTANGFWAFEMERRGAAEVVAIDIDDPARYDWPQPIPEQPARPANPATGVDPGFALAHRLLGSKVERVDSTVYDLPTAGIGHFDFVFMGALMLHLRDPVGALGAVREVTAGRFLTADSISLSATVLHPFSAAASLCAQGEPRWWMPNLVGYRRMLRAAGFEIEETGGPYFIPFGAGFPPSKPLRSHPPREIPAQIAFRLLWRHLGAASAWAFCRPA